MGIVFPVAADRDHGFDAGGLATGWPVRDVRLLARAGATGGASLFSATYRDLFIGPTEPDGLEEPASRVRLPVRSLKFLASFRAPCCRLVSAADGSFGSNPRLRFSSRGSTLVEVPPTETFTPHLPRAPFSSSRGGSPGGRNQRNAKEERRVSQRVSVTDRNACRAWQVEKSAPLRPFLRPL